MTKVLGSTHSFLDADDEEAVEFIRIVSDITSVEAYRRLMNYTHHRVTTRYQHCLNVAWYSYLMAKAAGLDYVSAARAGMLHDFYLYEGHHTKEMHGRHSEVHPRIALQNAEKYFHLNETEKDCILHHMWPSSHEMPHTKEGLILTIADKYCAAIEFGSGQAVKVPYAIRHAYRLVFAR